MEKKMYVQPRMEAIEVENQFGLLAGSADTLIDIESPAVGPAFAPPFVDLDTYFE